MGLTFSKEERSTRSQGSLKLEAQKVKEFTGHFDAWQKWKARTECAFDGSGYSSILTDSTYSERHMQMNRVVFAQLYVATVDGTAHHLVKQYEGTKDGNAAWVSLCEWYDGDIIKNETSETLRSRIEGLKLHSGMAASDYVNKYLMYYHDLAKIPGEGLSTSHGVYLFLRNITDPDYAPTVSFLRNTSPDLTACVTAIRKSERDSLQKKQETRKFRQTIRRMRDEESNNKDKRKSVRDDEDSTDSENETPSPKKKRRVRRVKEGGYETTMGGYLSIPYSYWVDLPEDHKVFVQNYNAKVKHNEPVKELSTPKGFVFHNKARRVDNAEIIDNTSTDVTNDSTADNIIDVKDDSIEDSTKDSEDIGVNSTVQVPRKKRITFNLEHSESPEEVEEKDQ
jgi:hypothetical protein